MNKSFLFNTELEDVNDFVFLCCVLIFYVEYHADSLLFVLFVCFVALRPKSTAMVIAGRYTHADSLD